MPSSQFQLSHSGLCLCGTPDTTFGANGTWLSPRQSFAKARGIVETIKSKAATAAIKVHHLRGNIAVLEGSGGNIAVQAGARRQGARRCRYRRVAPAGRLSARDARSRTGHASYQHALALRSRRRETLGFTSCLRQSLPM